MISAFKEIQALISRYSEIFNIQVSDDQIRVNYRRFVDITPNYECFELTENGCIELLEWIENNLTEWQ